MIANQFTSLLPWVAILGMVMSSEVEGEEKTDGYLDSELSIRFPPDLGGLKLRDINEMSDSRAGYSLYYDDLIGLACTLYIYDLGLKALGNDTQNNPHARSALNDAIREIRALEQSGTYYDVRPRPDLDQVLADSLKSDYLTRSLSYGLHREGIAEPLAVVSHTLLMVRLDHFVKIRCSYPDAQVSEQMARMVRFAKAVAWGLHPERRGWPPMRDTHDELWAMWGKTKELYGEEAMRVAQEALTAEEERYGRSHLYVAIGLSNLASLHRRLGRYAQAEPLYERALAIDEAALGPEHPDTATSLNNLAGLYHDQGRYAEAEPLYQRALAISEAALGPEHPDTAMSLNNLASLYHAQGRYSDAEPLLQRALAVNEAALGPEHPNVANSLSNLASLYRDQGRHADAEPLYQRALAIAEAALGPEHPDTAMSLNNLAGLYHAQGRYSDAEPLLRRALAVNEAALGPEHPAVATSLSDLALLYEVQGRDADAEPLYQRALAIREAALGPEHPAVATSLNNLAVLYKTQGRYALAVSLYQRALDIVEAALGPDHPRLATLLGNLAGLNVSTGRAPKAMPLLRRTIQIDNAMIDQVFSAASEHNKLAFLRTVNDRFEMLENLVAQKFADDGEAIRTALNATLRRKGIVLDAMSAERQAIVGAAPEVAELDRELQDVTSRFASTVLAGPGNLPSAEYRIRLDELEAKRENLEQSLASQNVAYATRRQSRRADATQVARTLGQGSALIEYLSFQTIDFHAKGIADQWGSYRYVAFVLPAGAEAEPVLIDLGEAEPIDEAVRDFRQEVTQAAETMAQIGEAEAEKLLAEKGQRLYELAFEPVKEALGDAKALYLAPDGELNLIPFGVLPDEEGVYLAETYQLNYLSSGRDLLGFAAEDTTATESVIMGDPDYERGADEPPSSGSRQVALRSQDLRAGTWSRLPGTRREVEAIAGVLGEHEVTLHVGADATEDVVKSLSARRVIHLATHGFFLDQQDWSSWRNSRGFRDLAVEELSVPANVENPLLRSGLVFAGANNLGSGEGEDGILTALEVSGLPLWGTDLVVLSACETGVGETRRGEGVFGLRRAFQLAGARTVVMSLWSVPDEETATLMTDFYSNLDNGKSRALREAQLAMIADRREKYGAAHPFYWGAFVSVGEP